MDEERLDGRIIAHYRIEEKLGQGGMGVVYRALDTRLHRPVAIKFLPAKSEAVQERRDRFLQEARSASALNHPNIVTIHEIGRHEETDFIVMEFVPGKTLHELIHSRGLSLSETLKYAIQIADAMAIAHGAGIVHRDLKPANILIGDRGVVKIVDFGLAKRTEPIRDQDVTHTMQAETLEGLAVGTLPYMSPEQAEGKRVDARSDIFSFGAILYEMVTGRRAFRGDSPASTLIAVATREPPPIQWPGGGPNELDRIIWRCLR
jgi:serine/threonine protein kinase